jgi:biotin transport system substrate-specific component
MQSFAVILLSALYGRYLAIATIGTYILEGVLGIPVFQGMKIGIPALFSPTGGYIIGFLAVAFVIGSLADKGWGKSLLSAAGLFIIGAFTLDILGMAWLIYCVGVKLAISSWISYQFAFLAKTGLGTILLPLIKSYKSNTPLF